MKKKLGLGTIYRFTKSVKKPTYTMRFIPFNPLEQFVDTAMAKDIWRRRMHISKKKMTEEYDGIYATWMVVGRGKNAHIEFNKSNKAAANIIFIVPKKWRLDAYKSIVEAELPYDKHIFRS